MNVIKKDGTLEEYNEQKIINAVSKSADRTIIKLTDKDYDIICNGVWEKLVENNLEDTEINNMHYIVESVLEEYYPSVAKSYRDYRNYKTDFIHMMDKVYKKSQAIRYIGDRSNANTDSALVPTQRSLIYNELNREFYRKFFLNVEERQAIKDGYIYNHDESARLDTMNCFRRDTKFITNDGIKSFYDFNDGDTTMVISHKGVWRKAVVKKYGWQPIQKVTLKKCVGTSKPVEIFCTSNHRWILSDGSETTNLKEGNLLYRVPDTTLFDWDKLNLEQKKLWCEGFAKGDGSLIGGANQDRPNYIILRLCGQKVRYAERFISCGYNVTKPNSIGGDMIVHMLDTTTKDIPFFLLNHENMKYYINGLMCADGNRNLSETATSEFRGIQVTGDLNNYIYDMLNMSGYFVTSTRDITENDTNYGKRSDTTIHYQLSSSQENTGVWKVMSIEDSTLNPKAEVWCLEVEEDHSFLLEHGIPTGNCCLANISHILKDGFEMGNVWYNEPTLLDVAFDVISDIAISMASCQYGGYTMPRVDTILAPYAEKSYKAYYNEYVNITKEIVDISDIDEEKKHILADEYAVKKVYRDFEQGFQSWEYSFNTVGSSRGDYPFIAISFGIDTSRFGKMASEVALKVRMGGQGAKGFKKPVLFPKLTFLYDDNLHGDGKPLEYLFDIALKCSSKTMYPDFLSLTGEGYIPSIYKKYGQVVSLMGCRASLSPWYEKGGMHPADENDMPVFEGRFNLGAISLNLPMILAKARKESKDFYSVLDYYLELIRNLHKKTYDFLGEKKASTNPLGYCEGGFYGGTLKPDDKIKPLLKPMTMSFGITALNELQYLYNKKTIFQDGNFALDVMKYINNKINDFKEEDQILYAIYGTPAESLSGLQVEQFRKLYGIIEGVSDRAYFSNSFHCAVWEDITPIQKQDAEKRFWDLFNGGKIQYCRYPISYNFKAQKDLVRRGMRLGFYEGCNLALSFCEECGYEQLDMDICPKCGSEMITKIDRMNGYIGYTKVHGKTRYNDSKNAEIHDRVSM